jgi:hypothetical protein
MSQNLTRRRLDQLPRTSIHEARNWSKADVYIVEWPAGSKAQVVAKDLKSRPLWYRMLAGRYFLQREWKALCALQNLPGIPRTVARPDADSFVIEFCDGKKAVHFPRGTLSAEAVQRVSDIVHAAHQNGVTHGDLHGDNILIDGDGNVTLIDWATAICFGAQPRGLRARIFQEWRGVDERAIAKLRIMHTPTAITARERELLLRGGSKLYRNVKKVRGWIQQLRGKSNEAALRSQHKFRYRAKKYYRPPAEEAEDSEATRCPKITPHEPR